MLQRDKKRWDRKREAVRWRIRNPVDPLFIVDDDDKLADGEEIIGMTVPNGFQLQSLLRRP